MGDTVNLASRLESITRHYGVPMMVGEKTCSMLSDFVFREFDKVMVNDKNKPVSIYEPIGMQEDFESPLPGELNLWEQFLRSHRSQEWDIAALPWLDLQNVEPSRSLYETFLQRIAAYRRDPPVTARDGTYCFEAI